MNDVVKFMVENWYLLIGGVGVAAAAGFMLYRFFKLPTKEQIAKIKEWLLYAVTEAEKELGGGTGQLKLRLVRSRGLGDVYKRQALEQMREMLEQNQSVQKYVGTH